VSESEWGGGDGEERERKGGRREERREMEGEREREREREIQDLFLPRCENVVSSTQRPSRLKDTKGDAKEERGR
jgi:hypothetical protein